MEIKANYNESRFKTKQRNFILNTAYLLFVERGIENVTMQEIAQACSMERRSLYNYYNDKDQLAFDIAKCFFYSIEEISAIKDRTFENKYEEIKALVYAFYDFAIADPDAIRFSLHFDHYFGNRLEYTGYLRNSIDNILHVTLIKEGIEDGSINSAFKGNEKNICFVIQGAMLSFAQRAIFKTTPEEAKVNIKLLLDVFLNSIRA